MRAVVFDLTSPTPPGPRRRRGPSAPDGPDRDPTALATAVLDGLLAGTGQAGTVVVGRPSGPDWFALPDVAARLAGWHADWTVRTGDRRAAAAYLASWVMDAPVAIGVAAVLGGVGIAADPAHLWLHLGPGGWFDRVAVAPEDVVGGARALALGARTVEAAGGLLVGAVSAALPIGAVAARGALADRLAARVLDLAGPTDPVRAWTRTQHLLDLLDVAGSHHRPVLVAPVDTGADWSHVRATCCLFYRTQPGRTPSGGHLCRTCPLRPDPRPPDHGDATG